MSCSPTIFAGALVAIALACTTGCVEAGTTQRGSVSTSPPPTPPTPAPDPEPTVEILYLGYNHARGCWDVQTVQRPESSWGAWFEHDCNTVQATPDVPNDLWWVDDGHCGIWAQPLDGSHRSECVVDDTTGWISHCDPAEHPCCDVPRDQHGRILPFVDWCVGPDPDDP